MNNYRITDRIPGERSVYLQLNTLATDEIDDTPSSPCFVTAMPTAAKNKLIANKIYLFAISFLLIMSSAIFI